VVGSKCIVDLDLDFAAVRDFDESTIRGLYEGAVFFQPSNKVVAVWGHVCSAATINQPVTDESVWFSARDGAHSNVRLPLWFGS
jgi:hypothetical protein